MNTDNIFTTNSQQRGISLLEVLAAIFVVSIGLLGVLAVIPFGAFQVSKAQHAEYASNMLANAAEEIFIWDMMNWDFDARFGPLEQIAPPQTQSRSEVIFSDTVTIPDGEQTTTETITHTVTATPCKQAQIECFGEMVLIRFVVNVTGACVTTRTVRTVPPQPTDGSAEIDRIPLYNEIPRGLAFNCTRFIWFEPRENEAFPPNLVHIFPLSQFQPDQSRKNLINKWEEPMRGKDDLLYTTYDDKRPDFTGQGDKILSSGKYNWFFTLIPSPVDDWRRNTTLRISTSCACGGHSFAFRFTIPLGRDMVLVDDVNSIAANVDLLACHNRVPDYDRQVEIPSGNFSPSSRGGQITFSNADSDIVDRLTQTKYVLVTWKESRRTRGAWCKIVFLDKDESSNPRNPKIVVFGDLPNIANDMHVYITNGVLYHKRLENVLMR